RWSTSTCSPPPTPSTTSTSRSSTTDTHRRSVGTLPRIGRTTGLLVVYAKCIRAPEEPDWDAWEDDVHLPALCTANGPWVATRFELTARPQPGMPGIGFTHVTIYELDDADVTAQAARTLDA